MKTTIIYKTASNYIFQKLSTLEDVWPMSRLEDLWLQTFYDKKSADNQIIIIIPPIIIVNNSYPWRLRKTKAAS